MIQKTKKTITSVEKKYWPSKAEQSGWILREIMRTSSGSTTFTL